MFVMANNGFGNHTPDCCCTEFFDRPDSFSFKLNNLFLLWFLSECSKSIASHGICTAHFKKVALFYSHMQQYVIAYHFAKLVVMPA